MEVVHKSPERRDWRKTSGRERIHDEVPSDGPIWMVDRNRKRRCTEERMERELNMVGLRKGKGKNTMTIDQGDKSEAQGFFKFIFFS